MLGTQPWYKAKVREVFLGKHPLYSLYFATESLLTVPTTGMLPISFTLSEQKESEAKTHIHVRSHTPFVYLSM